MNCYRLYKQIEDSALSMSSIRNNVFKNALFSAGLVLVKKDLCLQAIQEEMNNLETDDFNMLMSTVTAWFAQKGSPKVSPK